ncbi:TonB-dependent receptor, partial [Pseudomonas sp. SIMBA_059]
LSVVKTLTPDMDANSLGGTIEVESLSAFDHDGLFYTLTGEASHDTNVSRDSPKFSGAVSDRFSLGDGINNFGVAAAFSWQKRKFGSDN